MNEFRPRKRQRMSGVQSTNSIRRRALSERACLCCPVPHFRRLSRRQRGGQEIAEIRTWGPEIVPGGLYPLNTLTVALRTFSSPSLINAEPGGTQIPEIPKSRPETEARLVR